MIRDQANSFKPPFEVPCPPPPLRQPPPAYRLSPGIKTNSSKNIPSPPSGARFPGDRLDWKPLFLSEPRVPITSVSDWHSVLVDLVSGSDPSKETESQTLGIQLSDKISGSADGWVELPEQNTIEETFSEDLNRVIYLGCSEDELFTETPPPLLEEVGNHSVESPPRLGFCLDADSIRISELASQLGIKGWRILKDLIDMGIFAETSDCIKADTAVEVAAIHGVVVVVGGSLANLECPTDCGRDVTTIPSENSKFKLKNGAEVNDGDWIRDSVHGIGRILKLHSTAGMPDRHRVWFVGNTEGGTIIHNHRLLPDTVGVLDKSMVPEDIRHAAPEIDRCLSSVKAPG